MRFFEQMRVCARALCIGAGAGKHFPACGAGSELSRDLPCHSHSLLHSFLVVCFSANLLSDYNENNTK